MSNLELKNSKFGINGTDVRRHLARPLFLRKGSSVGVNMYFVISLNQAQFLFVIWFERKDPAAFNDKPTPSKLSSHAQITVKLPHFSDCFNDHKMCKKKKKPPQSVVLLVVAHKRARWRQELLVRRKKIPGMPTLLPQSFHHMINLVPSCRPFIVMLFRCLHRYCTSRQEWNQATAVP